MINDRNRKDLTIDYGLRVIISFIYDPTCDQYTSSTNDWIYNMPELVTTLYVYTVIVIGLSLLISSD
jgi:hypothetical protein